RGEQGDADHARRRERGAELVLGAALDLRPNRFAAGTGARDVEERHLGIQARERAAPSEREVIRQSRVIGLAHSRRRDAEAKQTRVTALEVRIEPVDLEEILANELAQLRLASARRAAADHEHSFDSLVEQALAQDG